MICYYCNGPHRDDPCPKRINDSNRFIKSSPYKDKVVYYLSPLGDRRKAYECRFSKKIYIAKHNNVSNMYIDKDIVDTFIKLHPSAYFIELRPSGIGLNFYIIDPFTGKFQDATNYYSW